MGVTTALLVLALLVPGSAEAGTLDQQQVSTVDCGTAIGATLAGGQSFTDGITGNLDEIDVFLGFVPASPPALTVQVENVITVMGGDIPGGTVLGTEDVTPPVAGWNVVPFSPTVPVTAGTKYAIVLSAGGDVGSWLGSDFMTDAYPAGNTSHNSGSGWAPNPSICDQAFRTYVAAPSAVTLRSASAATTAKGILVRWRTGSEYDLLGFHVYRSRAHSWRRLTHTLITAKGTTSGASYRYLDRTAKRGISYRYRIKAVRQDGTAAWFGPLAPL